MAKRSNANKELKKPDTTRARSGKSAAAGDRDDDDAAEDDDELVEFDAAEFKKHVKNVATLKSKAASIRGEIGSAVKNAEETHGIHRGAASLWIKLDNMQEEQRNAFLKAFDDMRTALGYATQTELFQTPAETATFGGRGLSN